MIAASDLKNNPPTRFAYYATISGVTTPPFLVTGFSIGTAGNVELIGCPGPQGVAGDDVTFDSSCFATGIQHAAQFKSLGANTTAAKIAVWGFDLR